MAIAYSSLNALRTKCAFLLCSCDAERYTSKEMTKIMLRKNLMICLLLFLYSCASNTGIIKIGEEKLFIAKQAATGFPGTGKIKTEALKEASQYCISLKKNLKIIELKENEGPYILGKYPRVELTFLCE